MTARDFAALAAVLASRAAVPDYASRGFGNGWGALRATIASDLADVLAADNPRFDRARFLSACSLEYAAAVASLEVSA